ncbi:MAG: right-handed parallel beta-helix repeat-containing protein [Planctomycetota bacterium JB042]
MTPPISPSHRSRRTPLPLGLAALLLVSGAADAAVVYVDRLAAPGGNGTSWATAFDGLAAGLSAAQPGDEIWVTAGAYANGGAPFQMPAGVALYGGFGGNETALSQRDFELNVTELDGQGTTRIMEIPDSAQPDTIIDGVTFKDGYDFSTLTIGTLMLPQGKGGAIYSYSGSPTIRNSRFVNNQVNQNGAVIYDYNGSPTFESCVFEGNVAGESAGVGYLYNASFTMRDCVLSGNEATNNDGGAIYAYSNGAPLLVNCLIVGNRAPSSSGDGGAIYRYGSSSNPVPLTMVNCTVSGNSAGGRAGAMYDYYGQSVIVNTILHGNTAPNAPNLYNGSSGSTNVTYSCVEGGFAGVGNIAGPPVFKSATDFHVDVTSPCLDAGDNTALPAGVATDLAGDPRFIDTPAAPDTGVGPAPIVDMGAYEGTGCPGPTTAYGAGCPGSGGVVPVLSATPCPRVGQQISLTFSNGLGGAPAIVFAGLAQGSTTIDPSCTLLTAPVLPPLFTFPLGGSGPGNGSAVLTFLIAPTSPVGLTATVQFFTSDPNAPFGVAGSNGLEVTYNAP